jgi:hypothetical protein
MKDIFKARQEHELPLHDGAPVELIEFKKNK